MKFYNKFNKDYSLNDKNFQKIIRFYLFECPVPGTSHRGKKFEEYGWVGSPKFAQLKNKMIRDHNLNNYYFPCLKTELEEKLNYIETLDEQEFIVFLQNDAKTVFQSLFKAIRNSFAHGSFNYQNINKVKYYYFENNDGYVKAKILIKEQTLLDWIQIVQQGYQY